MAVFRLVKAMIKNRIGINIIDPLGGVNDGSCGGKNVCARADDATGGDGRSHDLSDERGRISAFVEEMLIKFASVGTRYCG